jgi:hypothetical protein
VSSTTPGLTRRRFLGHLVASGATLDLVACGGGGSEDALQPQTRLAGKALITFVDHSANDAAPSHSAVDHEQIGLLPVADRFDSDSNCHAFAGAGSHALATKLPALDRGDFALCWWSRTSRGAAMRLLTLGGGLGDALSLDFNGPAGIVVWLNAEALSMLPAAPGGGFADDGWHHCVLQRRASQIELFVDGALLVRSDASGMRSFTTLRIGGVEPLPWHGSVDDLRLHDRAFHSDEIGPMVYRWTRLKPNHHADAVAAYYPFNGNASNDTGKGFDGVLYGGVTSTVNRFGDFAGAFAFNGVDAYIELQDSFDASLDDFSIGLWIRSHSPARMTAFSCRSAHAEVALLFNANAALTLSVDAAAWISVGRPGEFTDGAWHFVLLQRTPSAITLYVDGMLRGASSQSLQLYGPGSLVRIGRSAAADPADASFWAGDIDDVQLYERAFTAAEISELEQLQFRPRDGAGALVFAGRLWLLGGWNPDDAQATNSEIWSSQDGVHWHFVAHAPWEGRHTAGWLVFDDKLWVIGGDNNRGHYQNDVWSSTDGVHWEQVTDRAPRSDRATHYVLAFNGRMWLMGGQQLHRPPGQAVVYNDVYSSADGAAWRLESAAAGWSPRGLILGGVVFRDRMWVIGGGQYDSRSYHNDVWSSADGVRWQRVPGDAPWSARHYHSVTVFDNKIWVVAGGDAQSPGGTNDVWYSADGSTWTRAADAPWTERHAASVFSHGNALLVAAGSSTAVYNDVWKLGYGA